MIAFWRSGAGTGDQTLALARQVGPDGHVLATDLTEEMLSLARQRAAAAGLHNITFRIVDASKLDLEDSEFDAVVSGFTWMFLPDPVGSAARVRQQLKPGGRFAASVWGPSDRQHMISVALDAALPELGLDPPTDDNDAAADLSDAAIFHRMLFTAGFDDVSITPVNLRMFTSRWPSRPTSRWTMCSRAPFSSWASCSPSVGSSLRWAVAASSRILVSVRSTWSSSWKTSSW